MEKDYQQQLEELLEAVGKQNASDLHISVARHPTLRIDGELIPLVKYPIITPEDAQGLVFALLTDEQKDKFLKEKEIDFSYSYKDRARFRVKKDLLSTAKDFSW